MQFSGPQAEIDFSGTGWIDRVFSAFLFSMGYFCGLNSITGRFGVPLINKFQPVYDSYPDILFWSLVSFTFFSLIFSPPVCFSPDVYHEPEMGENNLFPDLVFTWLVISCTTRLRHYASHASYLQRHRKRSAFALFF